MTPTDEAHLPLYERLRAMGFDGIELPIFQRNLEAFARLGRQLDEIGLERTAVAIHTADDDPVSPDPGVREKAHANARETLDCAEAAGCTLLGGPLYSAIGEFTGSGASEEEWQRSREHLRATADYAKRSGITLALEFLNRFEIYLLNTAADTTRMAREVDRANLGVHYDTFHAHIEEKDVEAAITGCGDRLLHVHASENDRGTPGSGQVRWDETFRALRRIDYEGWITIEAFGHAIPSLAAATKIWRPLFDDPEKLAEEGLHFLRERWNASA